MDNLYEEKMDKTISVFRENLAEIRAGRANPAILNKITGCKMKSIESALSINVSSHASLFRGIFLFKGNMWVIIMLSTFEVIISVPKYFLEFTTASLA